MQRFYRGELKLNNKENEGYNYFNSNKEHTAAIRWTVAVWDFRQSPRVCACANERRAISPSWKFIGNNYYIFHKKIYTEKTLVESLRFSPSLWCFPPLFKVFAVENFIRDNEVFNNIVATSVFVCLLFFFKIYYSVYKK